MLQNHGIVGVLICVYCRNIRITHWFTVPLRFHLFCLVVCQLDLFFNHCKQWNKFSGESEYNDEDESYSQGESNNHGKSYSQGESDNDDYLDSNCSSNNDSTYRN